MSYSHTTFQGPKLSNGSVAPTLEVRLVAMLELLKVRNKKIRKFYNL